MKKIINILAIFFCLINTPSLANKSQEARKENIVRKLTPLGVIYKNKNRENRHRLEKAKKIRRSKNPVIVAVIGTGVHYKDPTIAHKILRPEELNIYKLGYLTKPIEEIIENCIPEPNNYNIQALKKETLSFKKLFYGGYLKKIDRLDPNTSHETMVSRILSEKAGDVLILPIAIPAGTKAGNISLIKQNLATKIAVDFAAKEGASIINMSQGMNKEFYLSNILYYKEIAEEHPNILFITSTYNAKENLNEVVHNYLNPPNLIVVAGHDSKEEINSNFGSNTVDVIALDTFKWLGKSSEKCNDEHPVMNNEKAFNEASKDIREDKMKNFCVRAGASFAAPRVAALAARIKKQRPGLSAKKIKDIICQTVIKNYNLSDKVKHGFINEEKALRKTEKVYGYKKPKKSKKNKQSNCLLTLFKKDLLYTFIINNYENLLQLSIDQGANVDEPSNYTGDTPLTIAALLNHKNIVEKLITAGADINKGRKIDGLTPLLASINLGHENITRILISTNGIDINKASHDKETPLYSAASGGYKNIVALLIKEKADVNVEKGNVPILMKIFTKATDENIEQSKRKDYEDIMQMLIDAGVNIYKKYDGYSVIDYTKAYPNQKASQIIKKAILRKNDEL